MLNKIPAAAEGLPTAPLASGFRVHPVTSDCMEPTLHGNRDHVLVVPVDVYKGEGIYLLDTRVGIDLFRVTLAFDGNGGLRLSRDNPRYGSHVIDRERFEECVIGIVAADIKVRDTRFLAIPAEGRS